MSSHIIIQSPDEMNSKFSTADRMYDDTENNLNDVIDRALELEQPEELDYKSKQTFKSIEYYLNRIPPREADLIRLYHKDQMKQEQIARLFGITQAAVSYRLARGRRRIQMLRCMPELNRDDFEMELGPKFNDQDREILWRMYETTCQSEIAKQMGLTQGRVRHRFFRSLNRIRELILEEERESEVQLQIAVKQGKTEKEIEKIKENIEKRVKNSKYTKYYQLFHFISDKHFNTLHQVSFPQFANRGDAQVLPIN